MKDKLRELADRWKADADKYPVPMSNEDRGYSNALYDCADDLLSILDAEGDGVTAYDVGWKIRGVTAYNAAKAKGLRHPECVEAAIKAAPPEGYGRAVDGEVMRLLIAIREDDYLSDSSRHRIDTLRNTHPARSGVMSAEYSVEEVRAQANYEGRASGEVLTVQMLTAYADMVECIGRDRLLTHAMKTRCGPKWSHFLGNITKD